MVTLNDAKHVIAAAEKKALDLLDYIRENVCPRVMLEQLLREGAMEGASNVVSI